MNLSNNEIILELVNDGWLESTIRNNCRENPFHEDLFQEICMIILEMDNNRMNLLHSKGDLKRYMVGVIKKQGNSNNSTFHYKYRKVSAVCDSIDDDPYKQNDIGHAFNDAFMEDEDFNDTKELINHIINTSLDKLDRDLFLMHLQGLTYKQIMEASGVSVGSAHRSVERSRMIIRNKMRIEHNYQ